MSVIYQNGGNELLGTLGSLATLAGTFIPGAQWLTPLGLGMNAANAAFQGKSADALKETLKGVTGNSWQNPASGSMAKPEDGTDILRFIRAMGGY